MRLFHTISSEASVKDRSSPPLLSPGQLIELDIGKMNRDGEGVGRYSGFVTFVPGTAVGDRVAANVITLHKKYARAKLRTVLRASAHRVTPPCEHYGVCGGCQLQHLSYEEQLRQKRQLVEDTLQRLGGLDLTVKPVLGLADPWHYRNKAYFPAASADGKLTIGFYAQRSRHLVNISSCLLQHPANNQAMAAVRDALRQLAIPAYDEKSRSGLIRHIMTRTSSATGQTLLALVTNGRQLPQSNLLAKKLSARLDNLAGIVQNINTRRGNVILGDEERLLWGLPYLKEKLGGLTFSVSSRSFLQVNTSQAEVLYALIKDFAALTGCETVFDLYCGTGTIGLYLSREAGKILGVESVAAAVADAKANALSNGLTNAKFHAGRAEDTVPRLLAQGYRADVVIIDPPRKGCDPKLLAALVEIRPRRLIYVSCDPATLARDLRYLTGNGFSVREVQPVDMFPHTAHIESVALMSRVGK